MSNMPLSTTVYNKSCLTKDSFLILMRYVISNNSHKFHGLWAFQNRMEEGGGNWVCVCEEHYENKTTLHVDKQNM